MQRERDGSSNLVLLTRCVAVPQLKNNRDRLCYVAVNRASSSFFFCGLAEIERRNGVTNQNSLYNSFSSSSSSFYWKKKKKKKIRTENRELFPKRV